MIKCASTDGPYFKYCIQCVDKTSGKTGDFIHNGDFVAISPVISNLMDFFIWCQKNGWRIFDYSKDGNTSMLCSAEKIK